MIEFISNPFIITFAVISIVQLALALRTLHFMKMGIGALKGHKAILLFMSGGILFLVVFIIILLCAVPALFADFLERDEQENS
ncbi:hypothetical protein [Desulforegula conservatrix]|uniref:hypothetical protein n=1 Tax=Desulforegula conservatrix TaxID=153026 RepID=UPI0003FFA412|nr:hypothetical protein [Desulforegula conservatrix]